MNLHYFPRLLATTLLLTLGTLTGAPLPMSAIGNDETVTVSSHLYDLNGGGAFSATIAGFDTYIWCVDLQDSVGIPTSYSANVTLLEQWPNDQNSDVQKGTITTWGDGLSLTALDRYQAAAWLITQTGYYNGTPTITADKAIQNAIWRLTYASSGGYSTSESIPVSNAQYQAAVAYIQANPTFGFGNWAVVSGDLTKSSLLLDSSDRRQTFLVQVDPTVPEPGTYLLMGLGLLVLAFLGRGKILTAR